MAKTKEKRAKSNKPSTGQKGPRLKLTLADLNPDERKVYDVLASGNEALKIAVIADEAFNSKPKAEKAKSRVRNSLRRLVRGRAVKHLKDRGLYTLGVELKAGEKKESPKASRKTTKKARKPKASKNGHAAAGEAEVVFDATKLDERLAELVKTCSDTPSAEQRATARVILASEFLGNGDTAIAKALHESRGFVIRRLKAIKDRLPQEAAPGFFSQPSEFWKLVESATA